MVTSKLNTIFEPHKNHKLNQSQKEGIQPAPLWRWLVGYTIRCGSLTSKGRRTASFKSRSLPQKNHQQIILTQVSTCQQSMTAHTQDISAQVEKSGTGVVFKTDIQWHYEYANRLAKAAGRRRMQMQFAEGPLQMRCACLLHCSFIWLQKEWHSPSAPPIYHHHPHLKEKTLPREGRGEGRLLGRGNFSAMTKLINEQGLKLSILPMIA